MKYKFVKSNTFFYLMIIVFATLVFVGTYGIQILNPLYLEVSYLKGDWTQHYFGWVGFRNSDWQFPIGLYDNNTYPDSTSIIFTDSIPILAIIFKVFRSILPSQFQYFGLFTLGCYIAQAVIGARIFKRFTSNKVFAFVGAILLLFVPILLHRTFVHEALSAQFLVVFMIETLLMSRELDSKKLYIRVGICAVLAAGIHMYFVLICGIVLVAVCLFLLLEKRYVDGIISLVGYIGISALIIWIEGGFYGGVDTSSDVIYELFSANINTLFNPCGKSAILGNLPIYSWGERDTTAYLGLGGIALLIMTIAVSIIRRKEFKKLFLRNKNTFIGVVVSTLVAFVFAVIPNVTFNDNLLFSVYLPSFIKTILAAFRCHGRTMWVIVYYLMILLPVVLYKCCKKTMVSVGLLVTILVLQIADVSAYVSDKYEFVTSQEKEETILDSDLMVKKWAEDESIRHVILYKNSFENSSEDDLITDVYVWANENNKTVNYIYLARKDEERYDKRVEDALNNPSSENIYILSEQDEDVCQKYGLQYLKIGKYIFARSIPLDYNVCLKEEEAF